MRRRLFRRSECSSCARRWRRTRGFFAAERLIRRRLSEKWSWIATKIERELNPVRLRPVPMEFALDFDI